MGSAPNATSKTDPAREELAGPTALDPASERRLLYGVAARTVGRRNVRIVGTIDDETVVAWGFYGGLITAVAGLVGLTYEGILGLWNIWPTLLFAIALVTGLMMARFGRRSTMEERDIAEVDLVDRELLIHGESDRRIPLDTVSEIVFGLSRYPLSGDKGAVKVQAASVLVRLDDRLVTVVGACTDKDAAFGVARFLGTLTGLPVKQVGAGIK